MNDSHGDFMADASDRYIGSKNPVRPGRSEVKPFFAALTFARRALCVVATFYPGTAPRSDAPPCYNRHARKGVLK
jgi:hypothetical protein